MVATGSDQVRSREPGKGATVDDVAAAEATLRDLSQFVRHAVPWSNPP